MTPNKMLWQTEFQPQATNFVLKEIAKWFDQLEPKLLRQSADIVMKLDRCGL